MSSAPSKAVVFAYSNVGDRCLRVLQAGGVDVRLVVTHRDHPGEALWFARVADTATELGLRFVYAEDLSLDALTAAVAEAQPDFAFSFYYRNMIPLGVLAAAKRGAFNLHGSYLPHFRGRAPTNWAVVKGATQTGATLHEMAAKPDAGAIVDQAAVPILPDDTAQQVFDKVCVAAELVLWRSLPGLIAGTAPRLANDIAAGSYFGRRTPEDGRLDFSRPAAEVYNLIRAVAPPYPGAFTELQGRKLIVAEARRTTGDPLPPGLHVTDGRMLAACGDGGLIHLRQLLCDGVPLTAADLSALLSLPSPHP